MQELQERMPEVAHEWRGHPVVRAPKSAPEEMQLTLENWDWSQMPSARALTMLASELLHHARIALDYCAFHVVWLDRGAPRDGTKFPLVSEQDRWAKERRNALPGITAEHVEWVRQVQPFAGVGWSTDLLKLSNRDKHRMAVEVVPTYRCHVDPAKRFADPLGDPEFWGYAVDSPRLELNIAPAMSAGMGPAAPDTRLPMDETLGAILAGVTEVVNRFLVEAGYTPIALTFDGPIPGANPRS